MLELTQQAAFEFAQTLWSVSHRLHLLQRPFPVALVDGLTQRWRTAEVPVSQKLDLADAELRPRDRLHEAFDLLRVDAVYAHKRP